MIKFSGIISEECKNFILQYKRKAYICIFSIICIPVVICAIVLSVIDDWIFLLILIPVILILTLVALKPNTKLYSMIYDKRYDNDLMWIISIEKDTIIAEADKRFETKQISDIKSVVDMGNWYKIYFKFPNKSDLFVCQKDLLVEGSIEEFEKLFAGKIKRKANIK